MVDGARLLVLRVRVPTVYELLFVRLSPRQSSVFYRSFGDILETAPGSRTLSSLGGVKYRRLGVFLCTCGGSFGSRKGTQRRTPSPLPTGASIDRVRAEVVHLCLGSDTCTPEVDNLLWTQLLKPLRHHSRSETRSVAHESSAHLRVLANAVARAVRDIAKFRKLNSGSGSRNTPRMPVLEFDKIRHAAS